MLSSASPGYRLSPLGISAALGGLALFAWTLQRTGLDPVYEGIRKVGYGFVIKLVRGG